jgi:hypothetical protein
MTHPEGQDKVTLKNRSESRLNASLEKNLLAYTAAAGAAGVGMLAFAQPAEAKIVYTQANVQILGPRSFYNLDLNNDGIVDFRITNTTNYNTDQAFWDLFVRGLSGNAVKGTFVYQGFPPNARALPQGARIGAASGHFYSQPAKMVSFYVGGGGYSAHGNWNNVTTHYLGFKFQIAGETHYGWARFDVRVLTLPVRINALLTGYAYETIPNRPIIAGKTSGPDEPESPASFTTPAPPQPAMLGLLAMGSPGLSVWRREELAEASGFSA